MQEMKSAEMTEPKLQLLSKITGAFQPGVLTALVGVSGAGYIHISGILSYLCKFLCIRNQLETSEIKSVSMN